jgi:carboxypeptidase C (cathepsin A)
MRSHRLFIQVGGLAGFAAAQFPPTPEGLTILKSKFHENVTISFKEVRPDRAMDGDNVPAANPPLQPGICETTPGVKSYSGYVHLPPGLLDDGNGGVQDYPINTFFWFFEARKDPANAPLAIWLNGGPGASSMMGLLEENGPCFVNMDSKTTYLNPWSWNNEVNMIYLDQPTQVGFSYDTATNCTFYPITAEEGDTHYEEVAANFTDSIPKVNMTHRIGTFSSQELSNTANTTATAAHALWHFMQTWFFEFPKYKPHENRVSLWGESYGGHYGPGFFRFFQEQNKKIENGSSAEQGAHYLHLDTLGIVNGLIDMVVQGETMTTFPNNNASPRSWLPGAETSS